ncbi:MAG: hypothetical protein GY749_50680 [Desulfobacteraceae bacterium]|nr:hypothetical protein [Desulfobacteraceae bacterium]
MKLSLRNKFLVPTIALIIVGSAISTTLSYLNSKKAIINMVETQINIFTESTASQINSWLKEIKVNIGSWSEEVTFKTAVQDTFLGESAHEIASERLLAIRKNYEIFDHLALANTDGEVIASASPELIEKLNVANRQYFQEALKGKTVVSNVIESKVTKMPIFTVSSPVRQYDETISGVLIGSIEMSYFNKQFIKPVKVGESGYAYLFDKDGIVIAHHNQEKIFKT